MPTKFKMPTKPPLTILERPYPPEEFEEPGRDLFAPSPQLMSWVKTVYLTEDGPLYNSDHRHLARARIGFLWTNVACKKQGKSVAGTAEIPGGQGSVWSKARAAFQLFEWFRQPLHFLITLDATYALECDDVHFAALVDHELYHCAQAVDASGCRRYNKEGEPVFSLRNHDVEEFVGVVRRFGIGAAAAGTAQLVAAAGKDPEIAEIRLSQACGNCLR